MLVIFLLCAKSFLLTQALKLTLKQVPGVIARLDRAQLTLLPGSLTLLGTTLETVEHPRATLLDLKEATVRWRWRDVLVGRLAASLSGRDGTFTLARLPPSPKQGKTSPHLAPEMPEAETVLKRWPDIRRRVIPFQIDSIDLQNLSLSFLDLAIKPALSLPVAGISLTGEGLTNRPSGRAQGRPGHLQVRGKMPDGGAVSMDVHLALSQPVPDMHVTLDADNIALSAFNPALKQYAGILLDAGLLSIALTADAKAGRFDGCVRPKLAQLRLHGAKDAQDQKSWLVQAAAKVADTAARLLVKPDEPPRSVQLKFSGTLPEGVTEEQGVLRLLAAALNAIKNEALTLKLAR